MSTGELREKWCVNGMPWIYTVTAYDTYITRDFRGIEPGDYCRGKPTLSRHVQRLFSDTCEFPFILLTHFRLSTLTSVSSRKRMKISSYIFLYTRGNQRIISIWFIIFIWIRESSLWHSNFREIEPGDYCRGKSTLSRHVQRLFSDTCEFLTFFFLFFFFLLTHFRLSPLTSVSSRKRMKILSYIFLYTRGNQRIMFIRFIIFIWIRESFPNKSLIFRSKSNKSSFTD